MGREVLDAAFDYTPEVQNDGTGWGVYRAADDEVHVMPEYEGMREHHYESCWCHPRCEHHVGGVLVIHNMVH